MSSRATRLLTHGFGQVKERRVFRDRIEVAIFLGALVYLFLYWKIGIFITDNYTLINTLVNLAGGHLNITSITVGPPNGNTPGMHQVQYSLYGRNYGQLVLSLPALWLLEGIDVLIDPAVFLVGAWSTLVLVFSRRIGRLLEQELSFVVLGSVGSLVLFGANVWFAHPIDPGAFPVIAMQITSMVAAALIGVFLYRTVALLQDTRTAVFAGTVAVIGTPIAFWATIPKRHVFTALFAVIALYGYVASRQAAEPNRVLRYRITMYVAVAMTAWIHAAEGLILLAVVGPLDVLPRDRRSPRSIAIIAVAFFVALLPFFLTNFAISGDPLRPPRMLPNYNPKSGSLPAAPGGAPNPTSDGTVTPPSDPIWIRVFDKFDRLFGFLIAGLTVLFSKWDALIDTFVFSAGTTYPKGDPDLNLALLETTPILGALVAGIVTTFERHVPSPKQLLGDTNAMAVVFSLAYATLMSLLYLPRLPIHAQVTVRYLVPILPMLIVPIVSIPPVRRILERSVGLLILTVAATVLIGSQLMIAGIALLNLSMGEGVQLFGIIATGVGGLTAISLSLDSIRRPTKPIASTLALGIAIGLGGVFVVLTGLVFFQYGPYVLGFVGRVAEFLASTT